MFLAGLEWFYLLDGTLEGIPFQHFRRAQRLDEKEAKKKRKEEKKIEKLKQLKENQLLSNQHTELEEDDDSEEDAQEEEHQVFESDITIWGDEEELDTTTKDVVRDGSTQITYEIFKQYIWPKMFSSPSARGLEDIVVWTGMFIFFFFLFFLFFFFSFSFFFFFFLFFSTFKKQNKQQEQQYL